MERRSPVLSVEGLVVRAADGRTLLDGVSLWARAGERIGIIGPNGAGKTTLLRHVADASSGSAQGGDVAAVWERCPFAEPLSGRENVERSLALRGFTRGQASSTAASALAAFDLTSAAADAVWSYSFGMRRRLALAEAFAQEAVAVILDEPTIGLDPDGRRALRNAILADRRRATTFLIASNDPLFVAETCDRVLFLHAGRAIAKGTPAGLVARIAAPTVIQIEGETPTDAPPPGLRLLARRVGSARFAAADGSGALPVLCGWLVERGCPPRTVRIHEPDLSDVYFGLTGERIDGTRTDDPPS